MDRTIQLPMPNKRGREQTLPQTPHGRMDARRVDYVDGPRWAGMFINCINRTLNAAVLSLGPLTCRICIASD